MNKRKKKTQAKPKKKPETITVVLKPDEGTRLIAGRQQYIYESKRWRDRLHTPLPRRELTDEEVAKIRLIDEETFEAVKRTRLLEEQARPSVLFHPVIRYNWRTWTVRYGGVVGMGNTVEDAMTDFDRAWKQSPPASWLVRLSWSWQRLVRYMRGYDD